MGAIYNYKYYNQPDTQTITQSIQQRNGTQKTLFFITNWMGGQILRGVGIGVLNCFQAT